MFWAIMLLKKPVYWRINSMNFSELFKLSEKVLENIDLPEKFRAACIDNNLDEKDMYVLQNTVLQRLGMGLAKEKLIVERHKEIKAKSLPDSWLDSQLQYCLCDQCVKVYRASMEG
jgi:hypothetical protein